MTDRPSPDEKERVKAENHARAEEELAELTGPLPHEMSFEDVKRAHTRLRQKLTQWQTMAIQGKFSFKKVQELEPKVVEQLHKLEERAQQLQSGADVPRPGEY